MGSISYESEPQIDDSIKHGDWRDQLINNGYVVLKSVVSPERAGYYLDSIFDWLETFPFGFRKDDPSTWGPGHLPAHIKGGMYHAYSVAHERFFWEARMEPAIIDAFAKLWQTKDLLVSFDGVNLTLPAKDREPVIAWPHCVQGILNLTTNGPNDGGLIVLKGSSKLNEDFFRTHNKQRETWGPADWFGFTPEEVEWFNERGCAAVKVCAEPGDLILWDSRTVHYNCLPESDAIRSVLCKATESTSSRWIAVSNKTSYSLTDMCYSPASYGSPDDLQKKAKFFKDRKNTTHWPHANIYRDERKVIRLGQEETYTRDRPIQEPVETDILLKLAGVVPYGS
ncbi:hypothetical protein KVR01_009532 [Diaporthe batatas]|uniref:uncharacterized protein n=1 Tax=Diaporthe batatas TaxID=748121 RepID=UPI001D04D146|nr:uncharacterized protein KVR01_009532 [Diaporthe batatas]KAG8161268.1 hypothetical protein KVR01_009532 [Diaporthe batatas]